MNEDEQLAIMLVARFYVLYSLQTAFFYLSSQVKMEDRL